MSGRARVHRILANERGSALLAGLFTAFAITLLGVALFDVQVIEQRLVTDDVRQSQAFLMAETGLQRIVLDMQTQPNSVVNSSTTCAANLTTYNFGYTYFDCATTTVATPTAYTSKAFTVGGSSAIQARYTVSYVSNGAVSPIVTMTSTGQANDPVGGTTRKRVQAQMSKSILLDKVVGLNSISLGASGTSANPSLDSYDSGSDCGLPPCAYDSTKATNKLTVKGNGTLSLTQGYAKASLVSSKTTVSLSGGTTANGNVTAGTTISNSGTITGTSIQNSPSAPVPTPTVSACSPVTTSSTPGVTCGGSTCGSGNLDASGNVHANATSVTLAAGSSYCFNRLIVDGGSQITISGSGQTVIHVNNTMNVGGTLASASYDPSMLQIVSSYSSNDFGVNMSGTGTTYATIVAPNTQVQLSGTTVIAGAALGKTLLTSGSAKIHFDRHLRFATNLVAGLASFPVQGWKLCKNPDFTSATSCP